MQTQWLAATQFMAVANAIAVNTTLQSTTGVAQIGPDVRLFHHLMGGGILLQDVTKCLHVGVNAMHHLCLLPQVALHCHIDIIIPVTTASDSHIQSPKLSDNMTYMRDLTHCRTYSCSYRSLVRTMSPAVSAQLCYISRMHADDSPKASRPFTQWFERHSTKWFENGSGSKPVERLRASRTAVKLHRSGHATHLFTA